MKAGLRADPRIRADTAAVFPLGEVREARIVHAQVGSLPVVLTVPEQDLPAVAYDRRVNDRALTFTLTETKPPALRDVETGTIWRLSDGLAVEGTSLLLESRKVISSSTQFHASWAASLSRSSVVSTHTANPNPRIGVPEF